MKEYDKDIFIWTYAVIAQIALYQRLSLWETINSMSDEEYIKLVESYKLLHVTSIEYTAQSTIENMEHIGKGRFIAQKGDPSTLDWGYIFVGIYRMSNMSQLEFKALLQDNRKVLDVMEDKKLGLWYEPPLYLLNCLNAREVL